MSPEELDKVRVKEARRLWDAQTDQEKALAGNPPPIEIAARLAREGWTPPDPISPRLRAAREWLKGPPCLFQPNAVDAGSADYHETSKAFLAGVAWAVEKAGPVVSALEAFGNPRFAELRNLAVVAEAREITTTYRQEIGDER